jgi:hypothetical protein
VNDPRSKICKFHLLYSLSVVYGVNMLCEILIVQLTYVIVRT